MTHKPFDTLETFKLLRSKGFSEAAAEAICNIHKNQHDGFYDKFVTRDEFPFLVFKWFGGCAVLLAAIVAIWDFTDKKVAIEVAAERPKSTTVQAQPAISAIPSETAASGQGDRKHELPEIQTLQPSAGR